MKFFWVEQIALLLLIFGANSITPGKQNDKFKKGAIISAEEFAKMQAGKAAAELLEKQQFEAESNARAEQARKKANISHALDAIKNSISRPITANEPPQVLAFFSPNPFLYFSEMLVHAIREASGPLDIAIYNIDNETPIADTIEGYIQSHTNDMLRIVANELSQPNIVEYLNKPNYPAHKYQGIKRSHLPEPPAATQAQPSNPFSKQHLQRIQNTNAIADEDETGCMHNKYILFKGAVLTGSYNFTHSATYNHAENILFIRNNRILEQFKKNFERMFHGILPPAQKSGNFYDGENNAYFSDIHNLEFIVKNKLRLTPETANILIAATNMTSKGIIDEISTKAQDLLKRKPELKIQILVDKSHYIENIHTPEGANLVKMLFILKRVKNIEIYIYRHSNVIWKMHNKYMVLSDEEFITGSYNFTPTGSKRNYENIVILKDREAVNHYRMNFGILLEQSEILEQYLINNDVVLEKEQKFKELLRSL